MKEEIKKIIEELENEISGLKEVDVEEKERIEHIISELSSYIENEGHFESNNDNIKEKVERSIRHFEVTHPKITEIMGKISQILSNIGI